MNLRCVEDKLTFCFDVGTREDLFNRERKGKEKTFHSVYVGSTMKPRQPEAPSHKTYRGWMLHGRTEMPRSALNQN